VRLEKEWRTVLYFTVPYCIVLYCIVMCGSEVPLPPPPVCAPPCFRLEKKLATVRARLDKERYTILYYIVLILD